ncbi:hypothetical protein GCM10017567_15670 [Amycolatopsis bullii]|uniref:VWFA domain-containing protein n=2 Tax=Pseudonocardiaceae TaxID=2070 RepID=A0ABQ3K3E7_9PSEU|nr:hypothetical protein GCM10017567_15670 [Amycolatopsis bullii]
MSVHRVTRFAAALAVALLVALTPSPAAAEPETPTRAQIFAALGADKVPADYVVLLDTSGSMRAENRYADAVQSLGGLFEALSPDDRIALYTFDDAVYPQYLGPSRPAAELTGKLPPSPNPTGSTDLGRAMAVVLDELQRDGAAPVANVVLVTDGAHEPAAGSPYLDPASPAWTALRQRAKQEGGPARSVYAVPLGDGTSGAAVVKSVFDGTVVLKPAEVQNLREYLNRSKERVEIEKARSLLGGDFGSSLTAKWTTGPVSDGQTQVSVKLTSTAEHVPLEIENVRLEADDDATQVTVPSQRYRIDPGKSVDITGAVSFRPGDDFFVRRTAEARTGFQVHATVRSSWTTPLKPDIDLGVDREFVNGSEPVLLTRTVGSSWFLPVVIVLGLALLGLAVVLLRRRQDLLTGMLVVNGTDSAELARFALSGSRSVLDGEGLPGRGTVTPGRLVWGARTGDLKVSYSNAPDLRPPVAGRLRRGGSLILGGLSFTHIENGD